VGRVVTGHWLRPDVRRDRVRLRHPGVLATKLGYFGVKSTNVYRVQMGTKPAKVGHLQSLCESPARTR
jgi:hypothetical protein